MNKYKSDFEGNDFSNEMIPFTRLLFNWFNPHALQESTFSFLPFIMHEVVISWSLNLKALKPTEHRSKFTKLHS